MNNKFEKFKDFLYEAIDYFMIIGIIVLVVSIIGWRLDLLFTESDKSLLTESNREDEIGERSTRKNTSKSSPNEITIEKGDIDNSRDASFKESIKISVPSGSNSASIAEILKDNGLIENSSDFVLKTEEMNLSTKLKSGEFDLDTDDDLEDIIHILTR